MFCLTELSSSPLLCVEIPAVSVSPAHPVAAVSILKKARRHWTWMHMRESSSGKLYSLELCCLSILCSCLSKKNNISHWELLGETTLCGFFFSINRVFWVDGDVLSYFTEDTSCWEAKLFLFVSDTRITHEECTTTNTRCLATGKVMTKMEYITAANVGKLRNMVIN